MLETRVVYLEDIGKIAVKKMPLPELKPNQVLVKTHQASICGSERYFYRGITVRPQDEARAGPEHELASREGHQELVSLSWSPTSDPARFPRRLRIGPNTRPPHLSFGVFCAGFSRRVRK